MPLILVIPRSLRPLVVALVPGQQRSLDKLKAMREQLSNEVAEVINEFGPKLYDDFDQVSIFLHVVYLRVLNLCIPVAHSGSFSLGSTIDWDSWYVET
jgi:hypothetical protein